MPFSFLAKYQQDLARASYVAMSDHGLLALAFALLENKEIGTILTKVGVHGDLSNEEESAISEFIIDCVDRYEWERPDPGNLLIPIALARQFAVGSTDTSDAQTAMAFIADRRCEGVDRVRDIGRATRVSEVLPILSALDKREDLKAPYRRVRSRKLTRGEPYFADGDESSMGSAPIVYFVGQQIQKYALANRYRGPFRDVISVLGLYAERQIDHLDDPKAVELILNLNKRRKQIIDD